MKICFVGPANSAHLFKWCSWFSSHGHEVHVISFSPGEIPETQIHLINARVKSEASDISKLKYLLTVKKIKQLLKLIQPDIVNAHYATSYGITMALCGLKGYVLSVWGSDIYEFPRKSFFHRALLRFSLNKAGYLFSTSRVMAKEASQYTKRHFEITPFGVDMNLFTPLKRSRTTKEEFIVGTVKGLDDKYGIRYLLEAVAVVMKKGDIPIKLRIAGKGSQELKYRELANDLGIAKITKWLGFISQEEAAIEWANMDVAIIPSIAESFGVAAIEAQACGTALIISDAPGLMEVTNPGETSMVVKRDESEEIALAIEELYKNENRRHAMEFKGLDFVREHYELHSCFQHIETCFLEYVSSKGC